MDKPFTDFVESLCKDRKKLKEFARDPIGAVKRAGLGEKHLDALQSRDTQSINRLMEEECAHGGGGVKKVAITPEDWDCRDVDT